MPSYRVRGRDRKRIKSEPPFAPFGATAVRFSLAFVHFFSPCRPGVYNWGGGIFKFRNYLFFTFKIRDLDLLPPERCFIPDEK